jgi:O-antigen/teichoic acid export membrane protein
LGQLSGYAVGTLLSILATWRSLRTPVDRRLVRSLMQTSLPLVPSFALLFVITHGNKFFLQFFSGLEAVGIYAIGFSIGMASSVVVGAIQTAWYPYFMSYIERQDEARAIFGRIITYYVFAVGAISVSFFLCSRLLLVFLTNSAYHDAYKVVGLVATSQFFVGMFSLLLPPLYFAGEVKMVSVVQGGAAIVQCILSIALIPPFGALGAALALCGSTLFLVLLVDRWNRRRGIRYFQVVLDRGRILTFGVFGSVVAALSLIPISFGWRSQAFIVGVGLVSIAICIYVLLRESERSALRHLLWHRTV